MTTYSKQELANLSKQFKKEQRQLFWLKIKSNKGLIIGGFIFLVLSFLAIFGPMFLQTDPFEMKVVDRLLQPSGAHWFGTDEFGRDLFTRIIYGARVSLMIGLFVTVISSCLGLIIGLYASYYRWLDHVLMRICDGLIAIPGILLAISLDRKSVV